MNNDIEYQSVEQIKAFQEGLLHDALVYLEAHSPYYQRMFKSYSIQINKIKHIEDLVKIPFTEKKTCSFSTMSFYAVRRTRSSTISPLRAP